MAGGYAFTRVTADGLVRSGAGGIHTITISPTTATPTAGLMTLYDNTAESGTVILTAWVFATQIPVNIVLDAEIQNGLYIGYDAALANASVTVTWLS